MLSDDGKTLILKATNVLSGRYDITIDKVKDLDGKDVEKYKEKNVDFGEDTTAPTIIGTEKLNATQVRVKFSEPVKGGTISYKHADGSGVPGVINGTIATGSDEVVLTMDANVPVNKDIVATFVGVLDLNENIITPNPSSVTFQKGNVDGVAPTVTTISQTGS